MADLNDVFNSLTLPLSAMLSQKATIDETSLPNSKLNRAQADRFIDLMVDTSVLLKKVRVKRVDQHAGEINKLDLGAIVTEGASATSKASLRTVSESVIHYDTVKYRSAFDLAGEFEEDNIERGGFRDTIVNMFTKQISNDLEAAAIESDDTLTVGDAQSDSNNLLGVNRGWQVILADNVPSGQQVDAAGAAPSKELYYSMLRAIPARYRIKKPDYVLICPSGPVDKWKLEWSDRATVGGDGALATGMVPGPFGVRMLEVPLMPEDLSYGSNGTDGSQIWMTPPQNLIMFIQRDFTWEWQRIPRQDRWECTVHFRVDFAVENPEMVVLAKNVAMSGSDYTA